MMSEPVNRFDLEEEEPLISERIRRSHSGSSFDSDEDEDGEEDDELGDAIELEFEGVEMCGPETKSIRKILKASRNSVP